MLLAFIRQKHIMHYCGFLKSVFAKSIFYVFLASLAFADYKSFWNWVAAIVFCAMAVISWIRFFGRDKDTRDETALIS